MSEVEDELVNIMEKIRIPKTVTIKCPYCLQERDQSNMARHYKSEDCTWTPEEALRRKKLKKLEKKKLALQQLYQERLADLKAKFDAKIYQVDSEISEIG